MMCISVKKSTPSNLFQRQLQRRFSWPSTTSDVVKLTVSKLNDLTDYISDLNQTFRHKTETETNVSQLNGTCEANRKEMKETCLITRTVPLTKSDFYLQGWFRLQKAIKTINDISFHIKNQKERPMTHMINYLLCKEKDGVELSIKNTFRQKTESKGNSNLLELLFILQNVPQLTYDVLPSSLETYFSTLSSGSTVEITEAMSNNLLRLSSFRNFPTHINIFSSRLSSAGFYFTGNSDTVKCYACGISHSNWTSGEDPIKVHERLNPNCPHLQTYCYENNVQTSILPSNGASGYIQELELNTKSDSKNLWFKNKNIESMTSLNSLKAQGYERMNSAQSASTTTDSIQEKTQLNSTNNLSEGNRETRKPNYIGTSTSQNSTIQTEYGANSSITFTRNIKPGQNVETNEAPSSLNANENIVRNSSASNKENPEGNVPNLGVNLEKPKYPNYAPLQVRISTYQNWPGYLDQTPKLMATAGFLYAGYNDYTRCFFCGGGLRNWEAEDDPWVEHARWFPKCVYLFQNKGAKFIEVVQEKHKQVMAAHDNLTNEDNVLTVQTTAHTNESQVPDATTEIHLISQNPLNTIAARSVLEMGYTNIQVLQAIEKLRYLKIDAKSATATEIMTVLLEDNFEWNSTSSNTTQNPNHIVATCNSAYKSTLNSSVEETPIATNNGNSLTEEQTISTIEPFKSTSQGAAGEMSSNELATALDDSEHLLEENRQLRDQRLCKVCLDLEASIAFLPCGHLVCCADCAPAMRKCPICRARVKGTVKTFLV